MRSSAPILLLIGLAVLAFGLLSEWYAARQTFGWEDPARWLPDLITGLAIAGCGLLEWRRTPASRAGPLMVAIGIAWFAGNLTGLELGPLGQVGTAVAYLHRGPLAHLILSYPTGRLSDPLYRTATVAAYGTILVPPAFQDVTAVLFAALIVAVGVHRFRVSIGPERRARAPAARAAAAIAIVMVAGTGVRAFVPAAEVDYMVLLAYEVTLVGVSAGLLVTRRRTSPSSSQVTDLMVELGDQQGGTLRDSLADALGDPSLEIGYWLPEANGYVDLTGRRVALPSADAGRSVTHVGRAGQQLAVLIHDPAVLDDPGLVASVSTAARLSAVNARLHGEVASQVIQVQASRRRLLTAEQDERRRLAERLSAGADRTLSSLVDVLRQAHLSVSASSGEAEHIERAEALLVTARRQLGELAAGLYPRDLTEEHLAGALASVIARTAFPLSVEVDVQAPMVLAPESEAAAYLVCLEGLANIVKHASASQARIAVTVANGSLRIEVVDDGIGGADPSRGSGLVGLADRVEALGGTLGVESPVSHGTRLVAEFPLGAL